MFTRGLPAFAASTASGMNPPRNSGTVLPFNKGALPDADAKAHGTEIRCLLPTEGRYTTHISTRLSLVRSPIADSLSLLLGSDQPKVCHLRGTFLKSATYNERLITACQLPNKSSRTILLGKKICNGKNVSARCGSFGTFDSPRVSQDISGFQKKDPGVKRGLVVAMIKPTIRYLDNAPPTGWSHHQGLTGHAPVTTKSRFSRLQSLSWRPVFNTIGSEQRDLVWQPQLQLAQGISV